MDRYDYIIGHDISIHSLVKRETELVTGVTILEEISIHSLVKRETKTGFKSYEFLDDFNPLPRKEGDKQRQHVKSRYRYFNPLPRKEGDHDVTTISIDNNDFNPLPRKEGDWMCILYVWMPHYFNPLPRKEGDNAKVYDDASVSGFQSTPS